MAKFTKANKHGNRFQIGNPGGPGRPRKNTLLSESYKAKLADLVPGDKLGRTYAEVIADALIKEAKRGKVQPASELADRTEGKPRQAYDVKLSIMDVLAERLEKARRQAKKK